MQIANKFDYCSYYFVPIGLTFLLVLLPVLTFFIIVYQLSVCTEQKRQDATAAAAHRLSTT